VSLNGEWLAPSVDYTVSNDQMRVLISRTVSQNDQIDVMHFSAPSFIGKFAYRQFKDMMNRTHFKRIGNDRQYFLANTLYWYDKEIVLKDATGITEPNITASLPGIVFIDGERIEYWIKDGKLKYKEDFIEGLENASKAFIGLLNGKNFGKLVVKLNDDPTS